MITTNKFLDLLRANEDEVKIIIDKMTEADAKNMLALVINQMNNERRGTAAEVKSVTKE